MSEVTSVTWYRIPITGLPELRCDVKVTKDGRTLDSDGEPLPFNVRPFECGRDGVWLLGRQPLCESHARETARLMEDDIDVIYAEWKAQL